MFVKAEALIALNNPVMMMIVYGCIISLSWFGAKQVVSGVLTTGQLTSMFSYIMSILMSLMMLSMVFVMITMSTASATRISEVLNEVPDIADPADPVTEVKNGQIDFNDVSLHTMRKEAVKMSCRILTCISSLVKRSALSEEQAPVNPHWSA